MTGRRVARQDRGTRPDGIRRANRTAVVRSLHLAGARTRADLAAGLGLNRSTIKSVVDDLVGDGVVTETGSLDGVPSGGGTAGRPSLLVAPIPTGVWVVALDLTVDVMVAAAVGFGGEVLAERRIPTPLCAPDPSEVVDLLGDAVADLRSELRSDPAGVGVAVPGLVRAGDQVVRSAPNLGWTDVPLGALLAERVGIAVSVGNESDLGAVAEHLRGVAREVDDVVYLMADVGVGAGVISGGVALVGAEGYAGELGHMRVRRDGRRCRCGATGCWETEVGRAAALRALELPRQASPAEITTRVRDIAAGRVPRTRQVDDYADWFAFGLANAVTLLDPRTLVLGGLFAQVLPVVSEQVCALVDGSGVDGSVVMRQHRIDLCPAALGERAALIGAAEQVFDGVLERV